MKLLNIFFMILLVQNSKSGRLDGEEVNLGVVADEDILIQPFTNPETNCIIIREIMEALPAYNPVKTTILSYFKSAPARSMKAFREIAMDILEGIDYEDDSLRGDIELKVAELRELKKLYHSKFLTDREINFDQEIKEQDKITLEFNRLADEIKKLKNDIYVFNQKETKAISEVKDFAMAALEDQSAGSVAALIKLYNDLNDYKNKAGVFYLDSEMIDDFTAFFGQNMSSVRIVDIIQVLEPLNNEVERLKDIKDGIAFYEEVVGLFDSHKHPGMSQSELIDVNKIPENLVLLETAITQTNNKISAKVTEMEKEIEKEMKKVRNALKSKPEYVAYVNNLKFLKVSNGQKTAMKEKLGEMRDQQEKLNTKFGTLEMSNEKHFTIAQDSIEVLQKKLGILNTYAGTFQTDDFAQYSADFNSKIAPVVTKFSTVYGLLAKEIEEKIILTKDKLMLSQKILDLEEYFDTILGAVFAHVQNQDGFETCFTLSQLSYIFFNMAKTNVIIKVRSFVTAFLMHLPYIRSKEFIVYNYRIFTNETFIMDQVGKDNSKKGLDTYTSKLRQKIITTYANNWSFLVNMYKEYTEFGNESEGKALMKVGLGSRLAKVLGITAQSIFDLGENTSYNEYFGGFASELLHMIPFFGNVPFLTSIVTTILCYLAQFVIKMLIKFVKASAKAIKVFMSCMSQVFNALGVNDIYDLNYLKYYGEFGEEVNEDSGKSSDQAKLNVQIQMIETKYFESVETGNSAKNLFDALKLFTPESKVIHVNKMKSEVLRENLRQIVDANQLSQRDIQLFRYYDNDHQLKKEESGMLANMQNGEIDLSQGVDVRLVVI